MIGPERGSERSEGVSKFVSPHGSTRYVYYVAGVPVSALQVVSREGINALIANVYTDPDYRRQGYARELLQKARRDFRSVEHSSGLSEEGKSWARSVKNAFSKRAKTLYHGTIADHKRSIKAYGLWPSVGAFVEEMYGYDEADADELVFAADKRGMQSVLNAIVNQVGHKLNKSMHDVTDQEIETHGMIVVINDGEEYLKQRPEDGEDYYGEYPSTVEPGDYYSEEGVGVDRILTGTPMIRLLRRYGVWPRDWGPSEEKNLREQLMRLFVKANPRRNRRGLWDLIQKMPLRKVREEIRKHEKLLGKRAALIERVINAHASKPV